VTSASGKKVIAQTQDGVANDHPGNPPTVTPKTVDVAATQLPDEHQESSLDKDIEIFGDTFTEPISGMEFVLVKGGCYQMGSNLTAFEGPVHEVCVDDFYLAKYEVTQTQWTKIIGRHYSYFKGNLRPVERVTWDDAQRFIRQLNSRSGAAFRLPTEAEWEYAARSGGKDKVYSGTSDMESVPRFAWHQVNSNRGTHLVGMKKPNSLGLHDMSGNVWEWCSDWYDENYYVNSPRNNPQGPDTGTYRVIRGGEWELPASLTRTTYREAAKPHLRRYDIGFRLAFSLPQR
jgi:formylglycine-generating enzyme required for sulfatase activity